MAIRILQFIISTVFISVPEEAFIVALALMIIGKGEFLTFKLEDVKRFSIPVLTVAGTTSFLRIVLQLEFQFMPFLAILLLAVTINFAYRIRDVKSIIICFAASIMGTIAVGLIQLAYFPIILSYSSITIHDLNNVSWLQLLSSLPERIIEIVAIAIVISQRRNTVRVNLFKVLTNNRIIFSIFIAYVVLLLGFVYTLTVSVYMYRILDPLPMEFKIIVSLMIIMIPLCSLCVLFAIIYVMSYKEAIMGIHIAEEAKVMTALAGVLSNNGEYKEIKNELKEFEAQISSFNIPCIKKITKRRCERD